MLGFTLLVAIGLIGPAAAMWEKELHTGWDVNTGFIDPVFTSVDGDGSLIGHAGKGLEIDITTSGSSAHQFNFEVTNRGTVPVKAADITESFPGLDVIVKHQDPQDEVIIDPDQSVTGTIMVNVGTEAGTYHYNLELDYVQWNGFLTELWSWWHQPLSFDIWVTVVPPDESDPAIPRASGLVQQPTDTNIDGTLNPTSRPTVEADSASDSRTSPGSADLAPENNYSNATTAGSPDASSSDSPPNPNS